MYLWVLLSFYQDLIIKIINFRLNQHFYVDGLLQYVRLN